MVILYYVISIFFIVFVLWMFRKRKGSFYEISRGICWFGIFLQTLWLGANILPSVTPLSDLLLALSAILLPVLFFIFALFLMYYGARTIIKKDTIIKGAPFIGSGRVTGIFAYYYGALWTVAGLFLVSFILGIATGVLCDNNTMFCAVTSLFERSLDSTGKIVEVLYKPIKNLQ